MESLKIEYYEILEEEKLLKSELTFDQMEEDLESIKVGLQTLLLNYDDISKNESICNTALSNNDNSKSSFVKLPDVSLPEFHGVIENWKASSENIQNSAEGSSSNALVTQPAPLLAAPSLMPDAVINNPSEPQRIQTFSSLNKSSNKFVFLSTAIVGIWSPVLNSYVRGRVILDSASQSHFMTLQFASKLGLEKKKVNLAVSGLSENPINIKWKINNAFISNKDSSYTSPLDFLIVSSITNFAPSTQPNFRIKKFNDINRSFLADPTFDEPGKIDMIIGAELFYQIMKDGRKVISDNLTLINSVFGFIVSGSINTINHKSNCFLISESESIDNCIKKFWEIEEIIQDKPLSKE
ncbi:integrase catalytic domain-containing protein [Trichonephila inaurata madagascariensis]|uniref:Integrase catalytic domain-containing protein n=1 Tax=Trichonephila inaurata madagascariensis TaxID=2747483 RepID=A0A8X6Y9X8_9ARAC|nr:integrase catalytic domain-containing protein [Trichonephila inaurata madagascariensis]